MTGVSDVRAMAAAAMFECRRSVPRAAIVHLHRSTNSRSAGARRRNEEEYRMSQHPFKAGHRRFTELEARGHVAGYCSTHGTDLFMIAGAVLTGAEAARRARVCATSDLADLWGFARLHAHRRGPEGVLAWVEASPARETSPAGRGAAPRIDARAIYAERNQPHGRAHGRPKTAQAASIRQHAVDGAAIYAKRNAARLVE